MIASRKWLIHFLIQDTHQKDIQFIFDNRTDRARNVETFLC